MSKLMTPALLVLHFLHDFSLAQQAAVGAVDLGELPENFVVEEVWTQEIEAITATTTIAVGPTADPDGYVVAADLAGIQKGAGALAGDSVIAANQKLLLTTAVAAATEGKVAIFVKGFQAF